MSEAEHALLAEAVALDGARVTVRSAGAIAEVSGPLPVRRAGEWLTLGDDAGSHVHLREREVAALRFAAPLDGNAALELCAADGARVARVSFSRTNPERPELDAGRRARVIARFGHLEAK